MTHLSLYLYLPFPIFILSLSYPYPSYPPHLKALNKGVAALERMTRVTAGSSCHPLSTSPLPLFPLPALTLLTLPSPPRVQALNKGEAALQVVVRDTAGSFCHHFSSSLLLPFPSSYSSPLNSYHPGPGPKRGCGCTGEDGPGHGRLPRWPHRQRSGQAPRPRPFCGCCGCIPCPPVLGIFYGAGRG